MLLALELCKGIVEDESKLKELWTREWPPTLDRDPFFLQMRPWLQRRYDDWILYRGALSADIVACISCLRGTMVVFAMVTIPRGRTTGCDVVNSAKRPKTDGSDG